MTTIETRRIQRLRKTREGYGSSARYFCAETLDGATTVSFVTITAISYAECKVLKTLHSPTRKWPQPATNLLTRCW